jgi:hypothetical protein
MAEALNKNRKRNNKNPGENIHSKISTQFENCSNYLKKRAYFAEIFRALHVHKKDTKLALRGITQTTKNDELTAVFS